MSREPVSPMPRNARVEEHIYAGLSRAELHRALVGAVPTVVGSGPADADFEALLAEQEPLGPEFEAVWDANREKLYEP